jgi:hypothetical protein
MIQPRTGPSEPTAREVYQPEDEEEELVSFVGDEGRGQTQPAPAPQVQSRFKLRESNLLTKNGQPDRRFKGQRDLPQEEVINTQYRKASVGGVLGGRHVTLSGAPDRRFKENRSLNEDDIEIAKAEALLEKHGIRFRREH